MMCFRSEQKSIVKYPMELLQEERQKIIQEYCKLNPSDRKKSLCRFYLRGLCLFDKETCNYSHGVDDLVFQSYQGEPIAWNYERTDYNQTPFIPKVTKYTVLYDFQKEKIYTIEQIDENRGVRMVIRDKMVKEECEKFLKLLEKMYPGVEFTSDFLEREFTRAGFNKPTGTISFKKIAGYLGGPESKFFVGKVDGKDVLVQKRDDKEIQNYFGNLIFEFVLKNKDSKIKENDLKKELFKAQDPSYPPLNAILKEKRLPFIDYINEMFSSHDQLREHVCNNDVTIQGEATPEELAATALNYLSTSPKVTLLTKLVDHIYEIHKASNTNVNIVKAMILDQGYRIYHLPMVSFVYDPKSTQEVVMPECLCNHKNPVEELFPSAENGIELEEIEIVDSHESLERCLPGFLKSRVLAVDIEGRLRKGGHIEVIQFNNGQNVFLFDIFKITQISFDFELFQLIKLVVRKVMLDASILKIFHDSRHDCLALHEFMNTCTRNVFDTSGVEVLVSQLDLYASNKGFDVPFVTSLSNVKTPGLNQLLKKYNAPHGINKSKDKFHKMMSASFGGVFHERPFNEEYKLYCVKDVLDLIYLYEVMSKEVPLELSHYTGRHYVINSYEGTL